MKELPDHLKELIQPTPSGVDKLLAAWDGLSVETQLLILSIIKTHDYLSNTPDTSARDKIRIKALDSANDFVRYTAAKEMFFPYDCTDEDRVIEQKIKNDPSDLVKYALDRDTLGMFADERLHKPKEFFSLPHKQRLALVRNLTSDGESVFDLIKYAIKNNISEMEVSEILQDFLIHPKPPKHGVLLKLEYSDLRSIFELVILIPVGHKARNPFIVSLSKFHIEEFDYLDNLTEEELAFFLSKKTFVVEDYRKKIFWNGNFMDEGKVDKHLTLEVWNNSVTSNFRLTDEELSTILKKPDSEQIFFINCLAEYAQELDLHQDLAIYFEVDTSHYSSDGYYRLHKKIEEDIERLYVDFKDSSTLEYRLKAFRLVGLAKEAMKWQSPKDAEVLVDSSLQGDLDSQEFVRMRRAEYLYDNIVSGSVWETYISWESTPDAATLPRVLKFEPITEDDEFDYLNNSEDGHELDVVEVTESIQFIRDNVDYSNDRISRINSNTENLEENLYITKNQLQSSIFLTQYIIYGVGALMVFFLLRAG